jgi:hypothetical protein
MKNYSDRPRFLGYFVHRKRTFAIHHHMPHGPMAVSDPNGTASDPTSLSDTGSSEFGGQIRIYQAQRAGDFNSSNAPGLERHTNIDVIAHVPIYKPIELRPVHVPKPPEPVMRTPSGSIAL